MRDISSCKWLSLVLLSACASSPPIRFYTLNEIPPPQVTRSIADSAPVLIDRLTIPAELERPQLVRRLTANQLQVEELDEWAAPLEDMIVRVFVADLASRVPVNVVTRSNAAAASPVKRLSIDVEEFLGDSNCAVMLRATWTLISVGAPTMRGSEAIQSISNNPCSASALPAAMSTALAQLSDRIAAVIAR